jgi:Membrane magnesium transporter
MLPLLSAIGVLVLLHSAYSCLHYRMLLLELESETVSRKAPLDVWIEIGIALVLVLTGELTRSGSALYPVRQKGAARRPLAAPLYKTRDFDIYTTKM